MGQTGGPPAWRIGRVVHDHEAGDGPVNNRLDIAIIESKTVPNVAAAGDSAADRTWSWSPAPGSTNKEN